MEGSVRIARPDVSPGALAASVMLAARRLVVAHWGLLAVCALFLLAGTLVLDDYGISVDERSQRLIGMLALDYLAGGGDQVLDRTFVYHDRYYGVAIEAPFILVERILGLDDLRDSYLARHFLTHLVFLTGGGFCYLLVLRMFNNRMLALVAMVLFLLHPRIYAHSFINSKDVPFLAMFMVSLYLTHRAFRRDTLAAFALCGVVIGMLVSLRIMGIMLFGAVFALRALDLLFASRASERRRMLLSLGAFALVAVLTYYAVMPGLWTDPPGGIVEMVQLLSDHPNALWELFRGEKWYSPDGPPLEYVPVWVGITTPPAVLLLALAGAVALAWRALHHPRAILCNGTLRFVLLLLALPIVTVASIVVLETNIYDGWRHLYFLYAPFLLLAAFGLHRLMALLRGRWLRVGIWSLAGATVAVTVASMVRIHPLQDLHYNSLVDRNAPDYLVSQYATHFWHHAHWRLIREIDQDHPEQSILVVHGSIWRQSPLLSEAERKRISLSYRILPEGFYSDQNVSDREYTIRIYNNTLVRLKGRRLERVGMPEAVLRAVLAGEPVTSVLTSEPIARSRFDIHRDGELLIFVREGYWCGGEEADFMFVHLYPVDLADLPEQRQQYGFENLDIYFWERGTWVDELCITIVPLPDWPIANIHAGQHDDYRGKIRDELWDVRFSLTPPEIAPVVLAGEPVASSFFDIHVGDGELVYVRDACTSDDAGLAFFLHVIPVDADDLPAERGQYGFDNRDFFLWQHGGRVGERCVATVALPDYPIASIRTGQYDGTGERWSVEFTLPDGE